MLKLKIDLVSDVVCPWCYIGYKQLERALFRMQSEAEVALEWHPFELNRDMPPEGEDIAEHVKRKYGVEPDESSATRSQMQSLAADLGIRLDYSPGRRIYNTFDAHRVLHWARTQGKQTELKLALFKAYFEKGLNPSDETVLLGIVGDLSLDTGEVQKILESQLYVDEVRAEQNIYTSMGIQGVPTFIIDEKYPITGAQDAKNLARAFDAICTEKSAVQI